MRKFADTIALGRALWSFVDLVKHPEHLDRVFEISDSLSRRRTDVLRAMRDQFVREERGAIAIRDKIRLSVDLDELSTLPAGTLGRAFANHMRANGLDPKALPALPAGDDLAFIRAHLYETHDVWHAVTGFAADVAGELGLQAFYAAQMPGGLPMVLLAMGCLNTALYEMGDRERRLDAIARGWNLGRRTTPLFGVRWDELWGEAVDDVRARFGFPAQAG